MLFFGCRDTPLFLSAKRKMIARYLLGCSGQWGLRSGPAKLGLYYAQAVSRFDGESKPALVVDAKRVETHCH